MNADTQLKHDVLAQLEWDPSINAAQIGVAAKDHVVTLTGTVGCLSDKYKAERLVKSVYGVKAVANDIDVVLAGSQKRSDADIAAAAIQAMKWDAEVPDDKIKTTVRSGWITLEGTVEWFYQRTAAEASVRKLVGVNGVTNQITVRPKVAPVDVRNKIEAAFKRSAEIDARGIRVEATDGKVILKGTVHSWQEHEEAQQAAWAAPGVVEVENLLSITP